MKGLLSTVEFMIKTNKELLSDYSDRTKSHIEGKIEAYEQVKYLIEEVKKETPA